MVMAQDSSHPTGLVSENDKSREVIRARERKAHAALQLKIEGHTWEDIAAIVGYPTARTALVAVERALEGELKEADSKKAIRQMANKRLERLLRSVWTKATDEDHPEHLIAATKAKEIIAQYTKLNGADAPTEVTVYNPAEMEIDQWVASVVTQNAPELEQADIFSDIIEGELVD